MEKRRRYYMLVMAIIATIILGIKILWGWLMKIASHSDAVTQYDRETQGAAKAFGSWGLFNIYLLVTIWVLYGCSC